MAQVNGIDVDELREYVASVERDAAVADRDPVVVARWAGGDRAEVAFASGEPALSVGGADGPSAMKLLLASLVACDVDLADRRRFAGAAGQAGERPRQRPVGRGTAHRPVGGDGEGRDESRRRRPSTPQVGV